ncbi:MAG TPA: NTP transferase domain-containing protein [Solirubrobacteraceae bacterium]|nr:NTP transferase domain-containing protein [Solirubrobacteraceae bacterium]
MSEAPLAAILAGGAGRRLGGAKPAALLAGRPLISYPIGAARAAGLEVVVVAKRRSALPPLDCELLLEPDEPLHPLLGVVTALRRAPAVLAIACDMPFVTAAVLELLARTPPPAAAAAGGLLQPLLAAYSARDLPVLEQALAASAPATATLARLGTAAVPIDHLGDPQRLCANVNVPAELAAAERLLG